MVRRTTLFALFLVSYIPLFFSLAIQNLNDKLIDDKGIAFNHKQIIMNNLTPIILFSISVFSFT